MASLRLVMLCDKNRMKYSYGAPLAVVTPSGRTVSAQMGDWNNGDPIIHIMSHQIESSVSALQAEGWQIPGIGTQSAYSPPTTTGSTMQDAEGQLERTASFHDTEAFESAARQIMNAVLESDREVSEATLTKLVLCDDTHWPEPPQEMRPVGRDPYRRTIKRPYCKGCGSHAHTSEHCPLKEMPVV